MYAGTLTWEANVLGLIWFIEKVWKDLKMKHPEATFYIIGKRPDQRLIEISDQIEGIKITGFVEDLEEYYKISRVFVVPLFIGSGVKIKVMNALYRGIPCVTTSIGVEGIDVENEFHICYSDQAVDFLKYTERLLTDRDYWEKIRDNSRSRMIQKYRWKDYLNFLDAHLEKLLN